MGYVNPYFIDNMGRHMGEVYGAVTDQILINLARYFPYYKPGQPVPQSAFEYQANMLAEMGQVTQETIKIIRNGLSDADGALQDVLQQAIMESVKKAQPDLLKAVQQGLLNPTKRPVLSPNQTTAYWTYYQQAADKLNLVNTVMLESTRQAYQSTVADITNRIMATQTALDVGTGEVVTGVSSWNQATMHAINRMKTNGITGFIDHGNHHWSAEAYTAMDIRTTVANTARAAVWETNQNFGNDLYLVSYHNGARPGCYPWQNKVISANDTAGVTYDLDGNEITVIAQSDTSYGEPAGLFGINCKHYPSPFIPGVSLIRGEPQSKEANDKAYEESQQQRALERKIREEKRDLMMLKAQNAPDEMIKAQRARIRQVDDEIDDFCAETGRHRRQNREAVYTKREFPDPKTYDVTTFERDQKEVIDKYFASGGSQQNYTSGQMTPNVTTPPVPQITPAAPATPTAQPVANVASQTIQQTQSMVQSAVAGTNDFTELKTYMSNAYGINVTDDVGQLNFPAVREALTGVERVVNDFPELGKHLKTIETTKSGVMACQGEKITFTPKYFTDYKTVQDLCDRYKASGWWVKGSDIASLGEHEAAHGVEAVLIQISGKYGYRWEQVETWNKCTEAKLIVSEAVKTIKKTPYGKGKKKAELLSAISAYANDTASESMAEAFADYYVNGTNANPLSIEIFNITKRIYNSYLGGTP